MRLTAANIQVRGPEKTPERFYDRRDFDYEVNLASGGVGMLPQVKAGRHQWIVDLRLHEARTTDLREIISLDEFFRRYPKAEVTCEGYRPSS